MVQYELYATSVSCLAIFALKLAFQNTWSTTTYLIGLSLVTSILNHGYTHWALQWADRVTVTCMVLWLFGASSTWQLYHVFVGAAILAFVWSKLMADDEERRIEAHKTSHRMAALAMVAM